ncbi:MAG: hypothetical protein F6K00_22870 [Leptolyngbya sp. SIOISBB]|nr:hypothetical protein [Leptolyngbya sp. SIOISBB]
MMTVSFQAFRDRYPDAHITSDLLLVQRDRFVVKVTVTTTSAGSASGLATHTSIEMAEDRARTRALAALGYAHSDASNGTNDIPNGTTDKVMMPEIKEREQVEAIDPVSLPRPPLEAPAEVPESRQISPPAVSPSRDQTTTAAPAAPKSVKTTAMPTKVEKTAPPTDEPVDISEPVAVDDTSAKSPPLPEPPVDAAAAPISTEALPAPINLSDVIAQTDIELRRLGWSVEAGRDYLEKTYQKRSRHELSEEELIQFLCHLESL